MTNDNKQHKPLDSTVISPPYDNLRTYENEDDLTYEKEFEDIVKELWRITKDGGLINEEAKRDENAKEN